MTEKQNKQITLAAILLLLVTLIIILIYANATFDLFFKLRTKYDLYKTRQIAKQISGNKDWRPAEENSAAAEEKSLVPILLTDPRQGRADAKVTIIEFSDFQCPSCAAMDEIIKEVEQSYGENVAIIWKDFPITDAHPLSEQAAEAARCSGEQGKFWEYHDLLFANQAGIAKDLFPSLAKQLQLDSAKFDLCLGSGKMSPLVKASFETGVGYGVDGTPYLFLNGQRLSSTVSAEQLKALIDKEFLLQ